MDVLATYKEREDVGKSTRPEMGRFALGQRPEMRHVALVATPWTISSLNKLIDAPTGSRYKSVSDLLIFSQKRFYAELELFPGMWIARSTLESRIRIKRNQVLSV